MSETRTQAKGAARTKASARAAGNGIGIGIGIGNGIGVGIGNGIGVGIGNGIGDGIGVGIGVGNGNGIGVGIGNGIGIGNGLGLRGSVLFGSLLIAVLSGCGGSPPPRPWIEEDLGGGFGGELGQSTAGEEPFEGEGAAVAAAQAGQGMDVATRAELRRAVRDVEKAEAASAGKATAELTAAWAKLERALLAIPTSQLAELERQAQGSPLIATAISLHAARLYLHARAPERAAPYLQRSRAWLDGGSIPADLAPGLRAKLDALIAAGGAGPGTAGAAGPVAAAVVPGKVAVLLPLSGRFAAVGQELRRAIELGRADRAGQGGAPWQFLDTRGEPAGAEAAVDQAVSGGAVAILGPVGDREAVVAARRASQRGVPIALLAPGDGADPALGVFRLGWSAEDEARAVAQWAQANDYQSVAVLAPRDDVGALTATAFAQAATSLGLTVAASGQYDAAGGSVEADIKRFLGLVPAQNPRLAAHLRRGGKRAWQTFVPDIPFTLLYIPDRADRAALVAAFLPYLGMELRTEEIMDPVRLRRKYRGTIPQVVQLVGGAGWNTPTLPARGGNAVQGAMIFDVCTAQRDDLAADFAGRLEARLGHAPTSASAQAYDAAAWLAQAVAAAQAAKQGDRAGVRLAMTRTPLEEGACGPLSIGQNGEVLRESATLQVDGEELILAP